MDTILVRTFLAVARHGSFTEAAVELHVVQSTVTSRVRALEKELKIRLLERSARGASMTSAGKEVARHAEALLDAEQRVREVATSLQMPAGDVLIGAPESMCAYRLPQVIASLRETHPAVSVHLTPRGTDDTFRGLLDRRLDVGLILDERRPPTHLTATQIAVEPIDVVASAEHPAASRRLHWHELAEFSYFLLEEGCSYSDRFLAELVEVTGKTPRLTRFGSIEAARACVEAGMGLSVLPRAAQAGLDHRSIVRLPEPSRPDAPLALISNPHRWTSPATRVVEQAIENAAADWARPLPA